MKKEIKEYQNLSSGFIKDFSYIRFVIDVINSGNFLQRSDNESEIMKSIRSDFSEINHLYMKTLNLISMSDFKKLKKNTMQISDSFIKIIKKRDDIEDILVELFAIYVLKYRFFMFKNKKVSDDLLSIVLNVRLIRLIKNISKEIQTYNGVPVQMEIDLAKNISILIW